LHASTEKGKPSSTVSLHYRARIQQSTGDVLFSMFPLAKEINLSTLGEDWRNSALMLSTVASDMFTKSVPHLRMSKIEPGKLHGLIGQKNILLNNTNVGLLNNVNTAFANNTNTGFAKFSGPPDFGQSQQQQNSLFSQSAVPPGQSTAFLPQATGFGGFGAAPAPSAGLFGMPDGSLFGGASQSNAFRSEMTSNGAFGASSGGFGTSVQRPEAVHAAVLPPPANDHGLASFEEITSPSPFSEPTTVVTEGPLSATYAVEGDSTIPSDGVVHQVSIAVPSFESKVTQTSTPALPCPHSGMPADDVPSILRRMH
jgi:hypothetical protein